MSELLKLWIVSPIAFIVGLIAGFVLSNRFKLSKRNGNHEQEKGTKKLG